MSGSTKLLSNSGVVNRMLFEPMLVSGLTHVFQRSRCYAGCQITILPAEPGSESNGGTQTSEYQDPPRRAISIPGITSNNAYASSDDSGLQRSLNRLIQDSARRFVMEKLLSRRARPD